MIENKKKIQTLSLSFGLFFTMMGIYNSIVINSDSSISGRDMKFMKRLDELYGINVPGRENQMSISWEKTSPRGLSSTTMAKNISKYSSGPNSYSSNNGENTALEESDKEAIIEAAVKEELELNLVEVINPKVWANGLRSSEFNGSLVSNMGVIEGLNVSLPGQPALSISGSELVGNVFEYHVDGEPFSGMMYQVDENAYMVSLTNGPLEGTRLRFAKSDSSPDESSQNILRENNIQVGTFGSSEVTENTNENFEGPVDDQSSEAYEAQNDQTSQREVAGN